jgi:hypothetical protein
MRKSYSSEFKFKAASMVLDEGQSVPEACASLNIGPTALLIESDMETFEQLIEDATVAPITKALIDRRPGPEALRHVSPSGA